LSRINLLYSFDYISTKEKASPTGLKQTSTGLHRGMSNDDEQFSRVKEPSDMLDTKDQQSR
jgi:hypothetical protein